MTWDMGMHIDGGMLEQYAENTARDQKISGRCDCSALRRMLKRRLRHFDDDCAKIGLKYPDETAPQAARWLLDNRYLAVRESRAALDALWERNLPAAQDRFDRNAPFLPAVWELARAAVRCSGGGINRERLGRFLAGIQRARPLEERELHLFVPLLILAAAEGVAAAAREVADSGDKKRLHVLAELCENLFSSLRFLGGEDLSELVESHSVMEAVLRQDPAGIYPHMDEESRAYYRWSLSRLALKKGVSEHKAAGDTLKAAREAKGDKNHIGFYVLPRNGGPVSPGLYVCPPALAAVAVALLGGFISEHFWVTVLLLGPVYAAAKAVFDYLILKFLPHRRICAMEIKNGVPHRGRTLCVISALLTGPGEAASLAGRLEQFRTVAEDCGKNLIFGLLCDLPDSKTQTLPGEESLLEEARREIELLNEKYGGFCLITRPRQYNPADRIWSGHERKRGAIAALINHIAGGEDGPEITGCSLGGVQFVITLDSDTVPSPRSLRRLIGAMLHPLNRPVVENGRVVSGHGIIVPAVETELESAMKSRFSRLFAGLGGIDPYCGPRGEVYQDLYGRGSYTGKGIISVEAFRQCMEGTFPENRVLSHDLLEGEYLRSGLMSDAEFSDGFPSRTGSYFSRLHRWVRGDWQAAGWMTPRVPRHDGKGENPLDALSKFKIFDNLRRSLTPALVLAALLTGILSQIPAFRAIGAAAAVCLAVEPALTGLDRGLAGRWRFQRLSFPAAVGLRGAAARAVCKFVLLPHEALLSLGAAVTALFRVHISHRNLLRWVTAGESDRRSAAYLRKMLPAMAVGAVSMVFAGGAPGRVAGLLWLFSPALCMWLDRPGTKKQELSPEDRAFLRRHSEKMWQYFARHMNAENNFLPPDNVQIFPDRGVARRTSPTNIGLGMLSALTASDLGFISTDRLFDLCEGTLSALERMEKWRGHLYNWYSTADLTPLPPRVASFVDSGNLAGCLIAMAAGLREKGGPRGEALSLRCHRLWREIDLGCMYDPSRRLFHLSADCDTGKMSAGYYDLLQSEARLASYIAVATGQADSRHWAALGRAQLRSRCMQGMASWTGTMFEYLMPDLLLPSFPGSAQLETARYCLAAQMRRVGRGRVWGVSESAFAMLDESLVYRYKASGVQALGLKTGLDEDLVVSPYSSFLALSVSPKAAVENLKNIEKLSPGGQFGLYEALDFTPRRLSGEGDFESVGCFMAHHLGMSIVACGNALYKNAMVRRFMSGVEMRAWSLLLKEKVAVDAPVIKAFSLPEPPPARKAPLFAGEFRSADPLRPRCAALAGGGLFISAADTGETEEIFHGKTLLRRGGYDGAAGMGIWFESGGQIYPMLPLGTAEERSGFIWRRCGDRVEWEKDWGVFTSKVTLAAGFDGVSVRVAEIKNSSRGALSGQIIFAAEPQMASDTDYRAHPAYSKLFIETKITESTVEFHRRGGAGDECSMVFALSREDFTADTSRPEAFGRGGIWSGLRDGGHLQLRHALSSPDGSCGAVTDPCLFLRCPIKAESGGRDSITAALSLGQRTQAVAAAMRACRAGIKTFSPRAGLQARLYNLDDRQVDEACHALSAAVFPPASPLTDSRELLWQFGISGDLPIFLLISEPGIREESLDLWVREFLWLKSCGLQADLIILTRDEPGYRRSVYERSWASVCGLGGENLIGKKGGIHILSGLTEGQRRGIAAFACHTFGRKNHPRYSHRLPVFQRQTGGQEPKSGFDNRLNWRMEIKGILPLRAMSHVMAFPGLGAVFCETGCLAMWQGNARENKILPWINDPLTEADVLGLRFETVYGEFSPFAARDGLKCVVHYGAGWAVWEKQLPAGSVKTTVFAARGADALVVILSGSEGRLAADPEIVMGSDNGHSRWTAESSGTPFKYYVNNFSSDFSPQAVICAVSRATRGDRVFVIGCSNGEISSAKIRALFQPAAARDELASVKAYWNEVCGRAQVFSPWPNFNNYVNQWSVYQTLACRLFARCSLYQCGGAYGFRDQLQDVCSLMPIIPELAAKHIIRCCENQFRQGDVAHWWHETRSGRRGVRTRYSDDLLWLPRAIGMWDRQIGDDRLLKKEVPYLEAPPLKNGEKDRYFTFSVSGEKESVLLHGKRALDLVLRRGAGEHGLCRILGGDWNDGMNLVGAEGRGESLWLTCLLIMTIEGCAPVFARFGIDTAPYLEAAENYRAAVAGSFIGDRFIRGYFDNGQVIGAGDGTPCSIDAISQGFAAMVLKDENARTAVKTAIKELFDEDGRLCALFAPPFDLEGPDPGYIRHYPPGVRENGGQYTHGVLWLALGAFECGLEEEGLRLMLALLPGGRDEKLYRAEPYVICADIYTGENRGMGGWSWYTGAAGWYWHIATEKLAGLQCEKGRIHRRGGDRRVELADPTKDFSSAGR